MPREVVTQVLPQLVKLLTAKSFVVHTYAAQAIERVFMIKTPPPNGGALPQVRKHLYITCIGNPGPTCGP